VTHQADDLIINTLLTIASGNACIRNQRFSNDRLWRETGMSETDR
jgi:hypothetical protein